MRTLQMILKSRAEMSIGLRSGENRGNSEAEYERRAWEEANLTNYYSARRSREGDLYPSERVFLPHVVQQVSTCLDIGCAAGGFSDIFQKYQPGLKYVGVDVVPALVRTATHLRRGSIFCVASGAHLPFAQGAFELVVCLGLLHLTQQYEAILRSAYAATSRYLLCDFRLTDQAPIFGNLVPSFDEVPSERAGLPYIVLNTLELVNLLQSLEPRPCRLTATGYLHPPSRSASIAADTVLMAVFVIEKGAPGNGETVVEVDFPRN